MRAFMCHCGFDNPILIAAASAGKARAAVVRGMREAYYGSWKDLLPSVHLHRLPALDDWAALQVDTRLQFPDQCAEIDKRFKLAAVALICR